MSSREAFQSKLDLREEGLFQIDLNDYQNYKINKQIRKD